jgi:hypothetical protein
MSEHTPGPWEIIQLPSGEYRIDAKRGPLRVCPAIAHGLADANLIAAAPEITDALRGLIGLVELIIPTLEGSQRIGVETNHRLVAARAALGKAGCV